MYMYVEYFMKSFIKLIKLSEFSIFQTNADNKNLKPRQYLYIYYITLKQK